MVKHQARTTGYMAMFSAPPVSSQSSSPSATSAPVSSDTVTGPVLWFTAHTSLFSFTTERVRSSSLILWAARIRASSASGP